MTYSEIKDKIIELQERLQTSSKSIAERQSLLADIDSKLLKSEKDEASMIEAEKNKAYDSFISEISEPFQVGISKLETKRSRELDNYREMLNKIEQDDYKEKYSSKASKKNELEIVKEIDSSIDKFYGEEFSSKIFSIIEPSPLKEDQVGQIIPRLRSMSSVLSSNIDFSKYIDDAYERVEIKDNVEGENIVIALVVGIMVIGAFMYCAPFVIILLLLYALYNIYKSDTVIRCISYTKDFKEYESEIDELINNYVKQAVERDKKKVQKKIDKINKLFTVKINELENMNEKEIERVRDSFVYDDNEIRQRFLESKKNNQETQIRLLSEIKEVENSISKIKTEITELEYKQKSCLDNLLYEYMPREIVPNKVIPKDYLLDIAVDKPVLFSFPATSCLVVYDHTDEKSLNEFILLMYMQTVRRMNPYDVKFTYYDNKNLGANLIQYQELECCDIVTEVSDINESIKGLAKSLSSRVKIMSFYDSIKEYNEFMISQSCPIENYNFILNKDCDMKILSDLSFQQLLTNGSKYGYYVMTFISSKEITNGAKDSIKACIDAHQNIYSLRGGTLSKRAKSFYYKVLEG